MLEYRRISLDGVAYFAKAELDLDWSGTTFVAGINRNSKSAGRRNGVGKSLLLSPLPHLAFGDPAGLPRNLSRHSLLTDPGSSVTWELGAQGSEWKITKRRAAGKSGRVEWSVSRDGTDVETHTATAAEKIVAGLMPFSEEEFYSLVYIDSRRPSPLLMGSPAARQQYLAGLLRIEEFDLVRERVRDRLAGLETAGAERDAVAGTLDDLDSADPAQAKRRWTRARKSLDEAKSEKERLQERLAARVLYERHREDLELSEGFDAAGYRELGDREHAMMLQVRQQVEYESYAKDRKEWVRELRKKAAAAGWPEDRRITAGKLDRWAKRRRKALEGAERGVRETLEQKVRDKRLLKQLGEKRGSYRRACREAGIRDPRKSLAGWEKRMDVLYSEYAAVRDRVGRIREQVRSKTAECMVCGAELSRAEAKRQLADQTKRMEEVYAEYEPYIGKRDRARELLEMWTDDDRKRHAELLADDSSLSEPLGGLQSKLKQTRDRMERLREVVLWVDNFLPEPKPRPSGTVDDSTLDEISAELARLEKPFHAYMRTKAVREQAKAGADELESSELKAELDAAAARIDSLGAKVDRLRDRARRAAADDKRRRKTEARLERMDRKLADRPVLSRLADAYGSKGLRLVVLRDAAERICSNLNRFAPLLFPERMEFAVDVSDGRLDIAVTRADGRTSDIRHMSGAESRIFSLVWLLGVLPLVPKSRRCNVAVLDEFEANLDAATRKLLLDEYLPALNEVVPHVVFVTPNDPPEPGHGRRVAVVEKKGRTSTVHIR